jgi:hypothetical protein
MSGGNKNFAAAYIDAAQAARAQIAQLLRELKALQNDLGESVDHGHHDHHNELEGLIDDTHHMERLSSFASLRGGIHLLKHEHHHHDSQDLAPMEQHLQFLERVPPEIYARSLTEMEHAVETFAPEMEQYKPTPVHDHADKAAHDATHEIHVSQ